MLPRKMSLSKECYLSVFGTLVPPSLQHSPQGSHHCLYHTDQSQHNGNLVYSPSRTVPLNRFDYLEMSRLMRKPTICICENKDADQLRSNCDAVTAKLISAFIFATRIVQFLYFLNPKFPVSSHLLCLYSPVCVGPVRKPHCWFSHGHGCGTKKSLFLNIISPCKKRLFSYKSACTPRITCYRELGGSGNSEVNNGRRLRLGSV